MRDESRWTVERYGIEVGQVLGGSVYVVMIFGRIRSDGCFAFLDGFDDFFNPALVLTF
jgi:hypothetical protein